MFIFFFLGLINYIYTFVSVAIAHRINTISSQAWDGKCTKFTHGNQDTELYSHTQLSNLPKEKPTRTVMRAIVYFERTVDFRKQ